MLFDKFFGLTELTEDSLKALSSFIDSCYAWEQEKSFFIEIAYIKNNFMPKLFLPRNKEIAERFISDKDFFSEAIHLNLLKDCDLSDFVKNHEKELVFYPSLYSCAAGYKMDDEAAWILMENPQFDNTLSSLNMYSVWFRKFQDEDTNTSGFQKRLRNALRLKEESYRNIYDEEVLNEPHNIDNIVQNILSFHLSSHDFISTEDFSDYFGASSKNTVSLSKDLIFWMLQHHPSYDIERFYNVIPVLIYAKNVPKSLMIHVEESKRNIRDISGDFEDALKWNEILEDEEFKRFFADYPHLAKLPITDIEEIWNNTPEILLDFLILVYHFYDKTTFDFLRVKVFKKYLIQYLEGQHGTHIVSSSSLEQLISIYETSKEEDPIV